MSYLVDTDRVASYLNGRPDAVALLTSLRHEGLAISIVTYGEIYDSPLDPILTRGRPYHLVQYPLPAFLRRRRSRRR